MAPENQAAIDRLTEATERQNALLEQQNQILSEIADGIEDRVKQEGLKHGTETGPDSDTGRTRQL